MSSLIYSHCKIASSNFIVSRATTTTKEKEEPNNVHKKYWNLLSNQILDSFIDQKPTKLYSSNKFTKNTLPLIDLSLDSPAKKNENYKMIHSTNRSKGQLQDDSPLYFTKQASTNKKTKFDSSVGFMPANGEYYRLSSHSIQRNSLLESSLRELCHKTDTSARLLSLNDIGIPNSDIKPSQHNRNSSMFELEIERLLDDEDDGDFLIPRPPQDDYPKKQRSRWTGLRSKSISTNSYINFLSSRSRKSVTNFKKSEGEASQSEIKRKNLHIRRKSCSCKQCGFSSKLAKASTIFLAEDIPKKPHNRASIDNESQDQKAAARSILKRNVKHKTAIIRIGNPSIKRPKNKVFQISHSGRSLRNTEPSSMKAQSAFHTRSSIRSLAENKLASNSRSKEARGNSSEKKFSKTQKTPVIDIDKDITSTGSRSSTRDKKVCTFENINSSAKDQNCY